MRKFFGTDGIRGIVNEILTPELAYKLSRAIIGYFKDVKKKKVIIGSDTRNSKDMLKSALIAGFTSGGMDILDVGVVSTPSLSYLVKKYDDVLLGIMISASHNPVEYNGIKIFKSDGFKLEDNVEATIEEYILREDDYFRASPREIGVIYNFTQALEDYKNYLKEIIGEDFRGYKIMLDCAFGSLSEIAPTVFKELGAEVIAYNTNYNGININDNCGAVYPEIGRNLFLKSGAHIGFTYDGDGDRVIAFSEDGEIVDGDVLIGIFAKYLKERGLLRGNKIVGTVMTNLGLEEYLKRLGIGLIRAKVGDRYVLEEILKNNLNLGGETSGHIILFDYMPTGDGLLTSLFLLKILKERGIKLSDLAKEIRIFPQVHEKIHIKDIYITEEDEKEFRGIAEEVINGKNIRYIVRKSGTEPVIRITVEGDVPKEDLTNIALEIKNRIIDFLRRSKRQDLPSKGVS
ncbi:phosphoglucosamine mutase [Dictyoglomus thermophilum]|uniref:Phosphoglucosamine mutase n=1 Tax=Dictyoglomus thermophilum (strain ATCC 35947 / DSM 3960 / H-6-12) TaxID=309799 RepID=GLMM_DICT6|nr:phosphoglucosamine mutase [Dictyoglomus thermophilum]B5YDY1.1 RecName: Full=Phosphoglucosamine mutase [Dictyoglomus thermophilum H-6-12]ACI18858.1 phosphoglucosamine mutase [Dictyoglomus thermophilum H-6-12]